MSNNLIPTSEEMKSIEIMAKNATDSKYFEKLGGAAGIFSICMYARELGIPVMSALFGGMQSILGKITISPQLMNSMIRRAGHQLAIDSTDERSIIKGTRKDTGESYTASFSVEEAKKANLFKAGGGWEKYPSDMCFARAISRLARRLFPDVIGSCYVEGEVTKEDSEQELPHRNTTSEKLNTINDVQYKDATVKEMSTEELSDNFYDTFKEMNQEILRSFISGRLNPPQSMKNALKDVEGFKIWFKNYTENKSEQTEK